MVERQPLKLIVAGSNPVGLLAGVNLKAPGTGNVPGAAGVSAWRIKYIHIVNSVKPTG